MKNPPTPLAVERVGLNLEPNSESFYPVLLAGPEQDRSRTGAGLEHDWSRTAAGPGQDRSSTTPVSSPTRQFLKSIRLKEKNIARNTLKNESNSPKAIAREQ